MKRTLCEGIFFEKKWETALRQLKPKEFYDIFWNIFDFQTSGGNTEFLTCVSNPMVATFLDYIKKEIEIRLAGARYQAKKVSASPTKPLTQPPTQPPSEATVEAPTDAPVIPPMISPILPKANTKTETESISKAEAEAEAIVETETASFEPSTSTPPSHTESKDKDMPPSETVTEISEFAYSDASSTSAASQKEKNQKNAYGVYGNIFLTESEYQLLTETYAIPIAYINHVSEKMAQNGYRYANHVKAIQTWWSIDKHQAPWQT